ncbi:MAG TPA: carbohydrate ABC transporter permease [Ideonella sp.]|uniref:carbohydrate ABC transporter permease n=1 Tax=Ideonella sp. TaxID=1929293 RepID=UPI002C9CAE98|nr:carbohydrate ABC transporter permease [Ideonella sp.]HSI47936.1 carbohydrate ABC transporter permease [Ideonella sp.]
MNRSSGANDVAKSVLHVALMLLAGIVFAYPMLFMVAASFKPGDALFTDLGNPAALLPDARWSLDNYRSVFDKGAIGAYLANSGLIALLSVTAGIFINSAAAFALAKLKWRGQSLVLTVVIALLIVPFEVLAIPMLLIVSKLPWFDSTGLTIGWLDTLHVQIIPFLANAFCVFLFYQFFKDVPDELVEAGRMDGAGALTIYLRLVMPVCKPVIVTAAIILFLGMWNQYLWPVMTVHTAGARPVMVGLQQFFGRSTQWGEVMAYACVITLPVMVFFLLFQNQFIRSVVGAGIKG